MKKTDRGPGRKPAPGTTLIGLFTSLVLPLTSTAQNWSIPYYFDDDVKQYSTVLSPNWSSGPHESAMAGTVYYGEDRTDVHFMRCDNQGPIITNTSNTYRHTGANFPYVDSTYMHTVDIEARDNSGTNEYFITCLSREHNPSATIAIPYGGTPNRDKITVLKVDDNGALLNAFDYTDATGYLNSVGVPYTGGNLYPTNSLYIASLNKLFICGYYTWDEYTTLPFKPDFISRKQIFIMSIDANSMALVGINTFDYEAATCPNLANGYYDFDIPMRMRVINNSTTYPGYIFMTGSINAVQPTDPSFYRSAVMNLTINPNTLAIMADLPFMSPSVPEVRGYDEYGIDLAETNVAGSANGTFIVGNSFEIGERHNADPLYWGFDPNPHWMWVTEVNKNVFLMPGAPNSKWYVAGGMSGAVLQVLPTNNPNGSGTQNTFPTLTSHFAVAGIQTSMHQGGSCSAPNIWPSLSNVTAFVADLHVNYTSPGLYSPGSTPPIYERVYGTNWTTYDNNSGTGSTGTWNNYTYMGGGIANIAWNPVAAARDNAANDVVLNAPKFGINSKGNSVLGIKWIRPINSGSGVGYDLPSADACVVEACAPYFIEEPVTHFSPVFTAGNTLTILDKTAMPRINVASYRAPDPYACSTPDGNPDNKPTKIDVTKKAEGTILYPNPASTEISIGLSEQIAANADVQVQLYNLYGQKIATLYKGKAVGLTRNTRLQLPDVASGLYLVLVTANKNTVLQQKLTIQ